MPTRVSVDDRLLAKAVRIGRHKTKKEAVTAALEQYIRFNEQRKVLDPVGKIDFDPPYDYKAERRKRT